MCLSEILVYLTTKGLLEGDSTTVDDLFIYVSPSFLNAWSLNFDDSHFSILHDRVALARLNIFSCFLKRIPWWYNGSSFAFALPSSLDSLSPAKRALRRFFFTLKSNRCD